MSAKDQKIAAAFVAARQEAKTLAAFPGKPPSTLAAGYRIQEEALKLWPDRVAGWKIGRVPIAQVAALGAERVAGPIFANLVWRAKKNAETPFPVIAGGFAAVEAEIVLRIGADAPPEKTAWSREDAAALVECAFIGVELAGSPLATINDLGSTVVVSDFGNNHGLILGPELPNWRGALDRGVRAETFVDDASVGAGAARDDADGPIEALAFLAAHLAVRGRPLTAGQLISTGALTGVHDVRAGQHARLRFEGVGEILCVARRAEAP